MSVWIENTTACFAEFIPQATDVVQQSSDKMLWLLYAQTLGIVLLFQISKHIWHC